MDASACENILTRRANHRHHSIIAQFVKPPMALPIEIAVTLHRNFHRKSGGYRTVTFFSGDAMPVYLITVFSKGERSNLTALECRALKEITKQIVNEHHAKVSVLSDRKKRGVTK